MDKFTKESFNVLSITQIPRVSLSKGVLKLLSGRELFIGKDEDCYEVIYSGDVFEVIACELNEMEGIPSQDVIDEIDNLVEIIETEYVKIIAI